MIQTVPVARCPKCSGWLTRRVLHAAETPAVAVVCGWCALDLELIDGQLVPVAYHPTPDQRRLLARHDHAARICDGTVRRREVGT